MNNRGITLPLLYKGKHQGNYINRTFGIVQNNIPFSIKQLFNIEYDSPEIRSTTISAHLQFINNIIPRSISK